MKLATPKTPICVICDAPEHVEENHAGGRNHIPWFKIPFCKRHHDQFHRQLEGLGINLRYTPNKLKRLATAAEALTIALWMVLQAQWEAISILPDKDNSST